MRRKSVLSYALIIIVFLAVLRAGERQEQAFPVSGPVSLSLFNTSGNITVKAWDRPEVLIVSSPSSKSAEASVQRSGDRIRIVAKKGGISYEVMTPERTTVEARSVSGDIHIRGLSGRVDAVTTSGNLRLEDIKESVTAKTVSGTVTLYKCSGDSITAGSVNGDLNITEVRGRVEGKSVSGDFRIGKSHCAGLDITTTSGNISYDGALVGDGYYMLNSHSGNLRLALPADASFAVTAGTFSGEIETGFPLTLSQVDTPRRHSRNTLSARYGDGKAQLELKTFSGAIRLKKQ